MEQCPDIPEAECDPFDEGDWDRQFKLMRTPGLSRRFYRVAEGVNTIDLSSIASSPEVLWHWRMLIVVLQLAVKDRASEVHFEPSRSTEGEFGFRMLYKVDGELLELVPPPYCVAVYMMRDIEAAAGFHTLRRRAANRLRHLARRIDGQPAGWESGRFRLKVGEEYLDTELLAYPSESGNRLFIHLPPIAADVSAEAWRCLRLTFDQRRKPPAPEQAAVNISDDQ